MTEHEARKLCTERHRDPDRDMTGPNGSLKAWEMYDTPTSFRNNMTEAQARERCYRHMAKIFKPNEATD